ncbi:hypothetical protein JMUB3935_1546 [Leptotrichia trevisanii]|uniref:Uncharacterized protein n=1 Tax=Leptotrichia trevisanii TaxID=109328 RepID=A0A510KMM8_9FUSO|nr:hypothetical protein [Leptotrichia trevisanii]BBM52567.1 hypothetical protein JMUB3935_1546 [Leptotrichia trevisanii]
MGKTRFSQKSKKCKSIKEMFKQILQKNDVTLEEFETISGWIKMEFKEEATFKKEQYSKSEITLNSQSCCGSNLQPSAKKPKKPGI